MSSSADEFAYVLGELAEEAEEIFELEEGRDLDLLRRHFPELEQLCKHVWLMELTIQLCKRT